jgi:hypothetical protein
LSRRGKGMAGAGPGAVLRRHSSSPLRGGRNAKAIISQMLGVRATRVGRRVGAEAGPDAEGGPVVRAVGHVAEDSSTRRCRRAHGRLVFEFPLRDGHRGHRIWPAGVEREVGDDLFELGLGQPVGLGSGEMAGWLLGASGWR